MASGEKMEWRGGGKHGPRRRGGRARHLAGSLLAGGALPGGGLVTGSITACLAIGLAACSVHIGWPEGGDPIRLGELSVTRPLDGAVDTIALRNNAGSIEGHTSSGSTVGVTAVVYHRGDGEEAGAGGVTPERDLTWSVPEASEIRSENHRIGGSARGTIAGGSPEIRASSGVGAVEVFLQ